MIEPVANRRFVVASRVASIFDHLIRAFHERVEPIDLGILDDWSYAYRANRNSNNLSCHASATAVDLNALRHPNGVASTFTRVQVAEITRILHEYEGVVTWGNPGHRYGWRVGSNPDEMHFEIGVGPQDPRIERVVAKLRTPAVPAAEKPIDWHALSLIIARQIVDARKTRFLEDGMLIYIPTGDTAGKYPILVNGFTVIGLDANNLKAHQDAGVPTVSVSASLWQQVVSNASKLLTP